MKLRALSLALLAALAFGGTAMAYAPNPLNGSCYVVPDPVAIGAEFEVYASGLQHDSPASIVINWHDDAANTADLIYWNGPYPEQTGPFVDSHGDLEFTVPAGWTAPATANRGTVQITTWNQNGTKFKYAFCEFVITP